MSTFPEDAVTSNQLRERQQSERAEHDNQSLSAHASPKLRPASRPTPLDGDSTVPPEAKLGT
jgi:hypothetical protein